MTAPAGLIHFTGESSILPRCRLSRVWDCLSDYRETESICAHSANHCQCLVFRSRRPDLSRPPLNHKAWPPVIISCKPASHSLKNTVLRRFISEEPCPKFIFLEKLPLFTFYIIHLLLVSHHLHLCPCEMARQFRSRHCCPSPPYNLVSDANATATGNNDSPGYPTLSDTLISNIA